MSKVWRVSKNNTRLLVYLLGITIVHLFCFWLLWVGYYRQMRNYCIKNADEFEYLCPQCKCEDDASFPHPTTN